MSNNTALSAKTLVAINTALSTFPGCADIHPSDEPAFTVALLDAGPEPKLFTGEWNVWKLRVTSALTPPFVTHDWRGKGPAHRFWSFYMWMHDVANLKTGDNHAHEED
jgi:hypothetical protein